MRVEVQERKAMSFSPAGPWAGQCVGLAKRGTSGGWLGYDSFARP